MKMYIFLSLLMGFVFTTGVILFLTNLHYSSLGEGMHSGFITSVDQRGLLFANYDIYFKTDNSSSQEDTYCVEEKDGRLANQLKELSANRKRVTIHYQGVRGVGPWLCSQGARILDVTVDE